MRSGRDILGGFGPDHNSPQRGRAESGGVKSARDVMGYSPPCGPSNINDPKSPGLHGDNYGIANGHRVQGGEGGSPGLHGMNKGVKGTQR